MGQGHSSESSEDAEFNKLINSSKPVKVTINNITYEVSENINPKTTLNYFIRNIAKLKGTKNMCLEGGCGVCIVAAKIKNQVLSVNSCLVPIFLCNGWRITTIEGIGGKLDGYNTLQSTLAEMNGSQCGYCSPAMVMNMFSLVEGRKNTKKEIENSFGSNICRCTGYRPILDTFHLFASDDKSVKAFHDIEDTDKLLSCEKKCNDVCREFEIVDGEQRPLYLRLKNAAFFKVFSVNQIFSIFRRYSQSSYILNGGNTGNGVYRMEEKDLYIDINGIDELQKIRKTDRSLTLGGNVTLENAKENLYKFSKDDGFHYLQQLADHIDLIGHVSLRNIGSIAGNLMLKHEHNDFPSDLFLILETSGAKVHILEADSPKKEINLNQFLKTNMKHKLIYSIVLPRLSNDYIYTSYKIMPRAQNAHADVNAAFLFKLDDETKVMERPNIIFGGINPNFLHASKTEKFLVGKILLDNDVLKEALNILDSELKPDNILPNAKPEYRKILAEGLFYKCILRLKPNRINTRLRSGGTLLQRDISTGISDYNTDRNLWPINQPIQKLEALCQTSGEAEYVNDIPEKHNEVFCAFAIAEKIGKIKSIDYSKAISMDGVVAFYSAKDIPGKNVFVESTKAHLLTVSDEPLFADKEIEYVGQPYGMIVANSQYEAQNAVKNVKLHYASGPQRKPIITIQDAFESNDKTRFIETVTESPSAPRGSNIKHILKGTFESGSQYHYAMEPICCVCVPIEDGLDVFLTTQCISFSQYSISVCLGIPLNRVNLQVRRLGGSYGIKSTRSTLIACATALAAFKLNKPARFNMSIEDMMKVIGKRAFSYQEYEVGIDDLGKIQYLQSDYWSNQGYSFNDCTDIFAVELQKSCYDFSTWKLTTTSVKTNLAGTTWTRAPSSAEGTAMIENIMERIAKETKIDPVKVRIQNLSEQDKKYILPIIDEIMKTSEYEDRRKSIELFNKENRWKKQGIAFALMKYNLMFYGPFHALVSIYARDGTVSISHAGIEMGQGINTKVAQVAAHTLGIDVNFISVKPSNNLISPNAFYTAGSLGTDCCASVCKYISLVKYIKIDLCALLVLELF